MATPQFPKQDWDLTPEAFADFLSWLDASPEKAGEKYESIRRRLIHIFICRGCHCPEELADESINRVVRKFPAIRQAYIGDPALYFYGVAHIVHLEFVKKKPKFLSLPVPEPQQRAEEEYECLEQCMNRLPKRSKEVVLQYYQGEKKTKINSRKEFALRLGIPLNALRIRAHRIRAHLYECVCECLQKKEADETLSKFPHI